MLYVQYVEHILDIHYIYTYVNVFVIYSLSYTCISVIVIVYAIYIYVILFTRLNFILYMYFCDIICICFYVQSVEHFCGYRTLNKYYYYYYIVLDTYDCVGYL